MTIKDKRSAPADENQTRRDRAIFAGQIGAETRDPGWAMRCMGAVERCARERAEFTSGDVWGYLSAADRQMGDGRALGGVMRGAQRDGLIVPTPRFRPSPLRSRHHAPARVWASCIHRAVPRTPGAA